MSGLEGIKAVKPFCGSSDISGQTFGSAETLRILLSILLWTSCLSLQSIIQPMLQKLGTYNNRNSWTWSRPTHSGGNCFTDSPRWFYVPKLRNPNVYFNTVSQGPVFKLGWLSKLSGVIVKTTDSWTPTHSSPYIRLSRERPVSLDPYKYPQVILIVCWVWGVTQVLLSGLRIVAKQGKNNSIDY